MIENGKLTVYRSGVITPFLVGFRYKSLYWLHCKYVKQICTHSSDSVLLSSHRVKTAKRHPLGALINVLHDRSILALHRKWGRISLERIKQAISKNMVTGHNVNVKDLTSLQTISTCVPCMQGRMRAKNAVRQNTSHKEYDVFEKIGIDFKGYFPVAYHGYKGFFLLSDKKSHFVYVYLVKQRSQALEALNSFSDLVSYYHKVWRILQCDSDSVFVDKEVIDWLNSHHIKLYLSTPYNHWQNGQVERDIMNVMDMARTLMADSKAPASYWYFAIKYACYVINRSPVKGADKTPYECVTGEKPDISHFVPFYCPGVYHCSKEERKGKAWAYKAEPCRMLGYDENTKDGYIVLKVRNGQVLTRRDCIFDENINLHDVLEETDLEQFLDDKDYQDIEFVNDNDINDIREQDNENSELVNNRKIELSTSGGVGGDLSDVDKNVKRARIGEVSDTSSDVSGETDVELSDNELDYLCLRVLLANYIGDNPIEGYDFQSCILMWYYDLYASVGRALRLPPQPKSVADALSGEYRQEWLDAINKEISQLYDREVFVYDGKKGRALKSKIVLRVSFDNNFSLKFKARLVVCGYAQRTQGH